MAPRRRRREDDPRAPIFFLSYSQNRDAEPRQRQFTLDLFRELSTHLRELAGLATGVDAGFIDRSMGGSERWTPVLLNAVGRCQVFVPLVSPLLAKSEWCGMEWDAFSRRTTSRTDGKPAEDSTCILPVTWVPTPKDVLPTVVGEIQVFSPELPYEDVDQYNTEGLYGLRAMGSERYDAVVWRLAKRIMKLHHEYRVEKLIPGSKDELENVFEE